MTPTQLLQLSIHKRRALEQRKERPLDRELLLTGTIARLCTYIGEARARRRQERREAKRRREQLLHENDFDETTPKRVCLRTLDDNDHCTRENVDDATSIERRSERIDNALHTLADVVIATQHL